MFALDQPVTFGRAGASGLPRNPRGRLHSTVARLSSRDVAPFPEAGGRSSGQPVYPVWRPEVAVIEPRQSPVTAASSAVGALVLVIEDEDAIRGLVRDTLEGEGYRVQAASSAEDAMSMLDQVKPALILLDLRLPGMDGFAFVSAYRDRTAANDLAPIILVSALRPREELPTGVVGYLRKPFDLDDLLMHVGRAISS
ncbi:MAG: hybrid sensor histidine kinase/response regulator [Dehalococcoidia bacterium]|nr:MAG: hybrid sensor histidine kinase/response regulator [Dehalococcoidia bacterium]